MSEVTKPLALDETLQDVAAAIREKSIGYYVVALPNNYAWGSVVGGGLYPPRVPVSLTATAKSGCYFLAWTDANGNIITDQATYTFTPTMDTVIHAIFSSQGTVHIVPWATGTDQELKDMLDAHYAGIIDIHDFWQVGDTRLSMVNAMPSTDGDVVVGETHAEQQVEWVLMDRDLVGITPADSDISALAFAVGMKNSLTEGGYMHVDQLSYPNSPRCAWCNTIFKNAIPATFRSVFKEFKAKWTNRSEGLTELTNTFAIPFVKCITGDNGSGLAAEGELYSLWQYYSVLEHRPKTGGSWQSQYWTSTIRSNYQLWYNYIMQNGGQSGAVATEPRGLSPFGCI